MRGVQSELHCPLAKQDRNRVYQAPARLQGKIGNFFSAECVSFLGRILWSAGIHHRFAFGFVGQKNKPKRR
jgi:hypothetical protein